MDLPRRKRVFRVKTGSQADPSGWTWLPVPSHSAKEMSPVYSGERSRIKGPVTPSLSLGY